MRLVFAYLVLFDESGQRRPPASPVGCQAVWHRRARPPPSYDGYLSVDRHNVVDVRRLKHGLHVFGGDHAYDAGQVGDERPDVGGHVD